MERQRIAQEVAQNLRGLILAGHYQPGTRLPPERQLAESLGVNRATLREALKNLEQAGLLQIRQGDGTRVLNFLETAGLDMLAHFLFVGERTAISIVSDIMEFRQIVGRELARLAAVRATDEHVQRLEAVAARPCATPEEAVQQDMDFYVELARASGNLVFVLLLNPLRQAVRRFSGPFAAVNPAVGDVRDHHREVIAALRGGDAEAAARAADRHLHRGKEHLISRLQPEGSVVAVPPRA